MIGVGAALRMRVLRIRAVVAGLILGLFGFSGAGLLGASSASAFDFFDGRLEVHGFFEEQVRFLGDDLDPSDDIDLAQWYHVLNMEIEGDIAPDGWGPFDLLSAFARVEVRYDCVWTRGCGIYDSVNTYGDRAERLPHHKVDGRRSGWSGDVFNGDISGPLINRGELGTYNGNRNLPTLDPRPGSGFVAELTRVNNRRPAIMDQIPGFSGLATQVGADGEFGAGQGMFGQDDPFYFYFDRQIGQECEFGVRETAGGNGGTGFQIIGPWKPKCEIQPVGRLRGKPNPFSSLDLNPVLFGFDQMPFTADDAKRDSMGNPDPTGSAELPGRPAPLFAAGDPSAPRNAAQGVFYPSPGYQRLLGSGELGDFDQNFRQAELEWNRGASQQDEKELKELYFDMEFLDSRLWVRAGKQSIVWGKTELFRTTDQYNPQDLALASLPSLEESRIALWGVRGVWSFYEVGPAEDVRAEVAFNFDQFEPADIGRCGEAFTALPACNKTFALWLHGLTGFALAGEKRPEDPWNDLSGLEIGARLEFRMGRFSFQISDFYGYNDFPHIEQFNTYERNVDPMTGRPRIAGSRGSCTTGAEPDCLNIVSNIAPDGTDNSLIPANQANVLANNPVNMQLFTMICATSIGFNGLDRSQCGQSIFNSQNPAGLGAPNPFPRDQAKNLTSITIAGLLSNGLAGNATNAAFLGTTLLGLGNTPPYVPLDAAPSDSFQADGVTPDYGPHPFWGQGGRPTLNQVLSDQQEAMLGCGAFYGIDCEVEGIDLANAEASVMFQSIVGYPGEYADPFNFKTTNGEPQPGTVGFVGPRPGLRYENGRQIQIAGTRSPWLADGVTPNPDYDPAVDGDPTGMVIPAQFGASAGQQFVSEMAALSWNFMIQTAGLASAPGPSPVQPGQPVELDEFNWLDPYGLDPNTDPRQCSWANPQSCSTIISIFDVSGLRRNAVRAGGELGFGRRDWVWHAAAQGVLAYEKRNVLGFSLDFAEDVTKSNWGMEATWIEGLQFSDVDQYDGLADADTYNMTISVDRPTFINFLNPNRTFFFNSQWFFQYIKGYTNGFTNNGPFNVLGTFTVQTGYFQDRLLPSTTFVYDVRSNSGAALTQVSYRFTETFSATVGMNFFWGRFETRPINMTGLGTPGDQVAKRAYLQPVENAVAVVRERDEFFLRLRYTF